MKKIIITLKDGEKVVDIPSESETDIIEYLRWYYPEYVSWKWKYDRRYFYVTLMGKHKNANDMVANSFHIKSDTYPTMKYCKDLCKDLVNVMIIGITELSSEDYDVFVSDGSEMDKTVEEVYHHENKETNQKSCLGAVIY